MRALYIECDMGASGDMLSSALWEIVENKDAVKRKIDALNIPNTKINFDKKTSHGISGFCAHVCVNGEEEGDNNYHHHSTLKSISAVIDSLNTDQIIKDRIKSIYSLIAQAESKVHNTDVELVHFHEVGALDAVADIALCALLFQEIGADIVVTSSINAGNGSVRCAHGVLPVPAPATAEILEGIPYYKCSENYGELCTPTGAAILKEYSDYFGKMPPMKIERTGIGFGKKEFDNRVNCIRVFLGDVEVDNCVCELAANVDDMTAEEISYALHLFLNNGALDAFSQSIQMKKGRPGYSIRVLCNLEDKNMFQKLIFTNTSTIGIREFICERYTLDRKVVTVKTQFGDVRVKISSGFGVKKQKIEYDDIEKIAQEQGITFSKAKEILEKCVKNSFTQQ